MLKDGITSAAMTIPLTTWPHKAMVYLAQCMNLNYKTNADGIIDNMLMKRITNATTPMPFTKRLYTVSPTDIPVHDRNTQTSFGH